ncbi:Ig-like domain-containing protein [Lacticaseibacillus baoqingensis]|uniref:Ig-like domain-containing protein n=1 Tax=Lacticaseibacillus baoqingensis TaxID=2486013 RepID=UPI000F7ABAC9|nr:Ig-like domain-containing protein [Lacticaseibacillus baoqingensis]
MKIRGVRSYERITTDTKQRYKMYKSGRQWVYAGLLTTFFVSLPVLGMGAQTVSADSNPVTVSTTANGATSDANNTQTAATSTDTTAQADSQTTAPAAAQPAAAQPAAAPAVTAAPTLSQPTVTANGATATLTGTATAGATISVTVDGVAQPALTVSGTGTYTFTTKAGANVTLVATKDGQSSQAVTVTTPAQQQAVPAAPVAAAPTAAATNAATEAKADADAADKTQAADVATAPATPAQTPAPAETATPKAAPAPETATADTATSADSADTTTRLQSPPTKSGGLEDLIGGATNALSGLTGGSGSDPLSGIVDTASKALSGLTGGSGSNPLSAVTNLLTGNNNATTGTTPTTTTATAPGTTAGTTNPTTTAATTAANTTTGTTTGDNASEAVGLTSTPTQVYDKDSDSFIITGSATPASRVTFKKGTTTIVAVTSAADGSFTAKLPSGDAGVQAGDTVSVTVQNGTTTSTPKALTLVDGTTETNKISKTGLLEGQLFGESGYALDNTALAQLGETERVTDVVKKANAANLKVQNSGRITDVTGTILSPTDDSSTDNNDSYDDTIAYGGKTYVSGADKQSTIAVDFFNDQGAISSDYSQNKDKYALSNLQYSAGKYNYLFVDPKDTNLHTRYADVIVATENPGLSAKVIGATTNGATFGFDTAINNSVSIGDWVVQSVNRAGAIVENPETGETFQITDASSMSNQVFGESGLTIDSKLANTAVVETTFTGGGIEKFLSTITGGLTGVMGAAGVVALVPDLVSKIVGIIGSDNPYVAGLQSSIQKVKDDQAQLAALGGNSLSITALAPVTKQSDGTYKVTNSSTFLESVTNYVQYLANTWIVDLYDMVASLLGVSTTSVNGGTSALGSLPGGIGFLLDGLSDTLNKDVEDAYTTVTNFIADTVGTGLGQVLDLGVAGSQKIILPVSWTDPDFTAQKNTNGEQQLDQVGAGDFTRLTLTATPSFFNVTPDAPLETSLVYQRTDKDNLYKQYESLSTEDKLGTEGTAARLALQDLSATKYNDADPLSASSPDEIKTDSDKDGISDFNEMYVFHTNERVADTDGDGLTDLQEAQYGTKAGEPNDIKQGHETALAADKDTDNDGISDADEVNVYHTNPTLADTDGDGLTDGQEIGVKDAKGNVIKASTGTNPLMKDTDGDGIVDGKDTSPLDNGWTGTDTDADGIPDDIEAKLGTDPNNVDTDGDGLEDYAELQYGTNPLAADTDADGVTDGQEVKDGTDPTKADTDGDNLTDGEEKARGTNPLMIDTDGDGYTDGRARQDASQYDVTTAFVGIGGVELSNNPSVTGDTAKGYVVTGQGTPGATVTITDPNGDKVGEGTVDNNGNYSINVPGTVGAETELTVTPSKDGKNGDAKKVITPKDPAQVKPTLGEATVTGDATKGYTVTGTGTPGATVTATDKDGKKFGEGTVGTDGKYSIDVPGSVGPEATLTLTPTKAGVAGDPITVTTPKAGETSNPSGETSNPSGETSNPSGETSNPSGETSNPSGETSNPSGETSNPSGETSNPSGETSNPSGETSNPSGETSNPSGETSNPSGETSNPSGETSNPSGETSNPSGETSNPSGETSNPSGETSNPSGETSNPSGETSNPSGETSNPSGETSNPSGETSNPSGETSNPSGETSNPSGETSNPSGETSNPSGETSNPSGETSNPSGETSNPSGETSNPSGETSNPSGETSNPSGETSNPSGETSNPSGETSNPSGETSNPSGETSNPSGETSNPSGETSNPSGETSNPSGETSNPSGETSNPSGETSNPSGETSNPADNKPSLGATTITGNPTEGYTATGTGTPGSDISVTDPKGNVVATGKVGDDGKFSVKIPGSVGANTTLTLTPSKNGVVGEAIKVITPKDNTSTDKDKLPAATNLDVTKKDDGSFAITGEGTPGATVTISNPSGEKIGEGTVGSDGKFTVTIPADAAKAGDSVSVVLTKDGKTSDPAKLTMPADEPTNIGVNFGDNNQAHITGNGVPGSTIYVVTPDGETITTGKVGEDGKFDITLPLDYSGAGDKVVLVQATDGGLSTPVGIVIPAQTPKNVEVKNDGSETTISGTGTPGSTITIVNSDGKQVGEGKVGDDGKFSITVDGANAKPGDALSVVQTTNGVDGAPVQVKVPATTPSDVSITNEGGKINVTGTGTPGSTITITAGGKTVGEGTVGKDGKFTITIDESKVKPGDKLDVTQNTNGANSDPLEITVPAENPADVHTITNPDGSITITGTGTPGSTVVIKDGNGNPIGKGTVGDDGKFEITIPSGTVKPGDQISVTQTTNGKDSTPIVVTVPSQNPGDVHTTTNPDGSITITGTGTPGSTVVIKDGNGNPIGKGTVGDDGKFEITIPSGTVKPGDQISVTQTTNGKDSTPIVVTVPNQNPGDVQTTTNPDGSITITGTGTPGATIIIKDGDGNTIGKGTVGDDGKFEIKIPGGTVKPGDQISVTQENDGKGSTPITITVPAQDLTGVHTTTNPDGSITITGTGTPGATVIIKDGNGNPIGKGTVGDDGKFEITIPSGTVKPGDSITVTQTAGGTDSNPTKVTVPAKQPAGLEISNDNGTITITGKGTPGSTITIKDGNGNVVGKTTVGADGNFSITVPKGALKPGQTITITQTTNGVDSDPIKVTVPSDNPEDLNTTTNPDGSVTVTGTGKPGSTVTVTDGHGHTIGTGTVGDDGKFTVTVPSGSVKPGDTIGVTQTTDGIPSKTVGVKVPNTANNGGNGTTTGNGSATGNGTTNGNGSATGNGTTTGNGSATGNGTTTGNGSTVGGNGSTGTSLGSGANNGSGVGTVQTGTTAGTTGVGSLGNTAGSSVGSSSMPATGEDADASLAVAGTIVLGLIGLLGAEGARRRRRED